MKKKINNKPAPKQESLYEAARHLGYYHQMNTSYKAIFNFAYLAQIMLFVANIYFATSIFGFLGVSTIIGSTGYSYLSQKDFYNENKKRGTIFQFVALGFAGLSFIFLSLSYFYQLFF